MQNNILGLQCIFSLTDLFKQIDEFVGIEVASADVERGHVGKEGKWQEVAELFLSKHEPERLIILHLTKLPA